MSTKTIPFPDAPSPDELSRPDTEDLFNHDNGAIEWYNDAVKVAANLFVQVASEHDECRERLCAIEGRELGDVREIVADYDQSVVDRVESMKLSAFQGGNVESRTIQHLREIDNE